MKSGKVLFACLVCVLVCAACGGGDDSDGITFREAQPGAEPRFELSFHPSPGVYRHTSTQTMNQIVRQGEQAQEATQETLLVMTMTVYEPDAEGMSRGEWSYERIRFSSNGMVFDTAEPPPAPQGPMAGMQRSPVQQVHKALQALKEARIELVFGPSGMVQEVSGIEEVWNRVGAPDMLRRSLAAEQIKMMVNNQVKLAPGQPVGVGAIWHPDLSFKNPLIGQASTRSEMELLSVTGEQGNRTATLSQVSRIDAQEGETMSMGGVTATVEQVNLALTGTVELELARGFVWKVDYEMDGSLRFQVQDPGGEQTVNLVIKSSQNIRTEHIGPPPAPEETPETSQGT